MRASDKDLMKAAFALLSPKSRYSRFFAPTAKLTASALHYFTEIDHHDHEALIALDEAGAMVGVARYVRKADDPAAGELAVTVADAWQGHGVGTALVALLADLARSAGIERFTGDVLWDNDPMHELLREFGSPDVQSSHGIDDFSLTLDDEPLAGRINELIAHATREPH